MNPIIVDRICDDTVSFETKVRIPKKDFKTSKDRVNYAKNKALSDFADAKIKEIKKSKKNSRELTKRTSRKQRAIAAAEINKISTDMRGLTNLERRKQRKVRYDTWRRPEMPTEEDIRLENMQYANFLGDKYGDNNSPYNTEYPVSLDFCDRMAEYYKPAKYQPAIDIDETSHTRKLRLMNAKDDDSLLMRARRMDGEIMSIQSCGSVESVRKYYFDAYAYIKEYQEDEMSELSLGSIENEDFWAIPDNEEYEQEQSAPVDVDAYSERIAAAFKSIHELTMRYQEFYHTEPEYLPEQNNKRDINEAYDYDVPQPALKRARCDDESYNV